MNENREEFQRDLERIEAKVIELFAMVAEDLPRATDALLSGDNDALAVLIEREQIIDALWPEIEELVNREIVLQAPVAVTCATCYPYCVSCLSLSARTTWSSRSGAGPITASARS